MFQRLKRFAYSFEGFHTAYSGRSFSRAMRNTNSYSVVRIYSMVSSAVNLRLFLYVSRRVNSLLKVSTFQFDGLRGHLSHFEFPFGCEFLAWPAVSSAFCLQTKFWDANENLLKDFPVASRDLQTLRSDDVEFLWFLIVHCALFQVTDITITVELPNCILFKIWSITSILKSIT